MTPKPKGVGTQIAVLVIVIAVAIFSIIAYACFHAASKSMNLVGCTAYYYSVMGEEYLYVTNHTTYTSLTSTTSSSVSTFISTPSALPAGYYATTIFKPPSAWEVLSCISQKQPSG